MGNTTFDPSTEKIIVTTLNFWNMTLSDKIKEKIIYTMLLTIYLAAIALLFMGMMIYA